MVNTILYRGMDQLFDIGLTLGLKNRLAEALTTHDYIRGKGLVSTTYFMMLAIFIPVSIIVILLIPFIDWPKLLNVPTIYEKDIQIVLYLLVIFMTIQMFFNVLNTVVSAYQKQLWHHCLPCWDNCYHYCLYSS